MKLETDILRSVSPPVIFNHNINQIISNVDNKYNQQCRSFVRCKIYKRGIIFKSLIDTGNLFETLISEEFANGLGLKIDVKSATNVGTAHKDGKMKILGKSERFVIYFEGIKTGFNIQAYVAENLNQPLNLGRRFIGEVKAKMEFEKDKGNLIINRQCCPLIARNEPLLLKHFLDKRFADVTNKLKEIPLLRSTQIFWNHNKTNNSWQEPVYSLQKITLKSNTVNFINVNLPGKHGDKNMMIEPELSNGSINKYGVLVSKGIYPLMNDIGKIAVMNATDEDIIIPTKAEIASASNQYRLRKIHTSKNEKYTINEISHKSVEKLSSKERCERKEFIFKKLKLEDNKLLTDKPHLKHKIANIFLENFDAVAISDTDYGQTDLIKFKINLEKDAKIIKHKVKPLNPDQLDNLEKQIKAWKDTGVIEPAVSPWGFRLVPVMKKNGKTRWCVDYRGLNAQTIKDSYPLTNIQGNLEKLSGAKIFSTLDSCGAYHNVVIEEDSRDYTTFVSPLGSFRFSKLPFGVSNAPACYSRLVDLVLQKIPPKFALGYLDDILTYSKGLEEHVEHLEVVVRLHAEVGMKLSLDKCEICKEEVVYLGHKVSSNGIQMVPEYIQRIKDWPTPTNVKELRTFLGFTSYYRSFLPEYSKLTYHMNGLKSVKEIGKPWKWSEQAEEEFQGIKKQFESNPIRAYPDYTNGKPFIVTTDFSAKNVAAVLSQEQNGKERFIAACGRKTMKYESAYPSTKGELLALVVALKHWEHILRYRPFKVITDSRALTFLKTLKDPRGIFLRWLEVIAGYNFDVTHKPGKLNKNADSLSRSEHLPEPSEEDKRELEDYIANLNLEENGDDKWIRKLDKKEQDWLRILRKFEYCEFEEKQNINNIPEGLEGWEILTDDEIRKAQGEDEILKEVLKWVTEGKSPKAIELRGADPELQQYRTIFDALEIQDGLLSMKFKLNDNTDRVRRLCLPGKLQRVAWELCHSHPSSGHFGITGTAKRMKRLFFFPGMYQRIRSWVKICAACIRKTHQLKDPKAVHVSADVGEPMEKVFIDLVGPLSKTDSGHEYLLTVEDGFTRWAEAIPIKDKRSETVCKTLLKEVISRHGLMRQIHSDQGREWVSNIWKDLMKLLQIKWTTTPSYNPRSNRVERFHRTLEQLLRTSSYRDNTDWDERLAQALLAYRTSVHSATGTTPFMAMYGREAILPIDLIFELPDSFRQNNNEKNQHEQKKFQDMYKKMRINQKAQVRRIAQRYKGDITEYEIGDKVWYYTPAARKGERRKTSTSWTGPWMITEKIAPILVKIKYENQERTETITTLDRIRKYHLEYHTAGWNSDDILNDFGDEFAEELGIVEDEFEIEDIPIPRKNDETNISIHRNIEYPDTRTGLLIQEEDNDKDKDDGITGEDNDDQEMNESIIKEQIEPGMDTPNTGVKRKSVSTENMLTPQEKQWKGLESLHYSTGIKRKHRNFNSEEELLSTNNKQSCNKSYSDPVLYDNQLSDEDEEMKEEQLTDDENIETNNQPQEVEDEFTKEHESHKITKKNSKKEKRNTPYSTKKPDKKSTSSRESLPRGSKTSLLRTLFKNNNVNQLNGKIKDKIKVNIMTKDNAKLPEAKSNGAAGFDIFSNNKYTILPGEIVKISTGVALEMPSGYWAKIEGRSGLALKGLTPIGGVIDNDYRGEIHVILINLGKNVVHIFRHVRIAQLTFTKQIQPRFQVSYNLSNTERGCKGFGSTLYT